MIRKNSDNVKAFFKRFCNGSGKYTKDKFLDRMISPKINCEDKVKFGLVYALYLIECWWWKFSWQEVDKDDLQSSLFKRIHGSMIALHDHWKPCRKTCSQQYERQKEFKDDKVVHGYTLFGFAYAFLVTTFPFFNLLCLFLNS